VTPAMELEASAELQVRRPPWRRTVAVQAALCLALYAAFSLGEPQLRPRGGDALGSGGRAGGGVSFITVAGGARPPADQARLLRQVRASPYNSPHSISSTASFPRRVLTGSLSQGPPDWLVDLDPSH
jgi:hypothetical protein